MPVQDKDRPLSELQRDRFEDLLRGLSAERRDVRTAMVFALDNAECAAEVVEILTDALTLKETPVPTKVRDRHGPAATVHVHVWSMHCSAGFLGHFLHCSSNW